MVNRALRVGAVLAVLGSLGSPVTVLAKGQPTTLTLVDFFYR